MFLLQLQFDARRPEATAASIDVQQEPAPHLHLARRRPVAAPQKAVALTELDVVLANRIRNWSTTAIPALHLKRPHPELERQQRIARIAALDLHLIRELEPHRIRGARRVVIGARRLVLLLRIQRDALTVPAVTLVIVIIFTIVVAVAPLLALAVDADPGPGTRARVPTAPCHEREQHDGQRHPKRPHRPASSTIRSGYRFTGTSFDNCSRRDCCASLRNWATILPLIAANSGTSSPGASSALKT